VSDTSSEFMILGHSKRLFTKLYPSFYVQYRIEEKNIFEISMRYDYRSKSER
jgi:hypothetical protein